MIRTQAERQAQRELEQANQLLIQQDKLANLKVITADLGHEITNPIRISSGLQISSGGTGIHFLYHQL